jgi:hypothetical protein
MVNNMKEFLLYGIAKNQTERYTEELLLVTTNKTNIDKVKELASAEGWHSFREASYNGEAPNFRRALA